MLRTLFGRSPRQSPPRRSDASLKVRPGLMHLEARDVPAVIYDNTFTLTGSGGNATVQVEVDVPYPAATPTYIWTYTVTNGNIGSNNPQDYINSDSQTSFWLNADAAVSDALAEFGFLSTAAGWTNGLFASADGGTTAYYGLYAGVNIDHPNLGHGESATFAFATDPRLIVAQDATFGDDTFGEATGTVVGPGAITSPTYPRLTGFQFQFSGGEIGTGQFALPVGFVPNASLPFQAVEVTQFEFSLAGVEFIGTETDSPPVATFFNGVFSGLSFDVSAPPAGFPYLAVSVSDGVATGIDGLGNVFQSPVNFAAMANPDYVKLNFKNVTTGASYKVDIEVQTQQGGPRGFFVWDRVVKGLEIKATDTVTDIRDKIADKLQASGYTIKEAGGDSLTLESAAGKPVYALELKFYDGVRNAQPIANADLKGPFLRLQKGIDVKFNGADLTVPRP